ncbi:malectin domain-containing carbohydrate-binding protein [Arcticibacter eurypsychrophilus]|uniref:malectin domain-containing carbohydrate-binding protein n=1 Tax=Arcticibacter eurypsychrophilus TaxID=1434752 RepID=UPI00084D1A06|nr:malectin domain-containing carbohydrate-binding protein [Arcticibacter eurypsychrophilus]
MRFLYTFLLVVWCSGCATELFAQDKVRRSISLDEGWRTVAHDTDQKLYAGFEVAGYQDASWKKVTVPHNWDAYEGYRRLLKGNRHGYAWYRKEFTVTEKKKNQRYFLFFEGVGSYATVWLNGIKVGYHAGGRTTFTLDVTSAIRLNKSNLLAVRADHPDEIRDLPWVDGGSSEERGFSEGSQPMGIFRPVHLIVTNSVRVEPFGLHAWNDTTVSTRSAKLNFAVEVKNYDHTSKTVRVVNRLENREGNKVVELSTLKTIKPGVVAHISQQTPVFSNPHLWSLEDPYLYTIVTEVIYKGKVTDRIKTPYGIRWISWPVGRASTDKRFLLNGKPVFINGIAEYEHLLGGSHAFSAEQIRSRVLQMKAAGFNAFRDAHQPHNLRYQEHWDEMGILLWTQMAAHIWFDSPEFRNNFKTLLRDWVKERRNSPSVVLWGLENESTLPEDFAKECAAIIREMDPTASSQRKVTTCNGGKGTDWDVPQNWTGTYGGDPKTYGEDVKRQVLIGEYGAWRTLDLHTEGPFQQNGSFSEDRMTQLMEMKVRLADSVKNETAGHFFWLFTSHDNPGRVQGGEGLRELDRIGPVNYKGLLTPWEEPLDVYYMFRSNYASNVTDPMVYIVSHTWANRWKSPGIKDSITVYSNCDEVELFNDVNNLSLGKRKKNGIGTHFQWDQVNVKYNVLYAVGYVNGKAVARDYIVLNNLPQSPQFNAFYNEAANSNIIAPQKNLNYLYRVNCGGPDYIDKNGHLWMADRQIKDHTTWGSNSWTADFPGMPAYFASQRKTNDPIKGTIDWPLFQTFRYGREKLNFNFPVPDGVYIVELYFNEPWLGTGGGIDCTGFRLFDVAVNGTTYLKDLDIWKEAGHDAALKKTIQVQIKGGQLQLSFPKVASGQVVISAIAIASADKNIQPAAGPADLIQGFKANPKSSVESWMDAGDKQFIGQDITFTSLPPVLYGADWIKATEGEEANADFTLADDADVFVAVKEHNNKPAGLQDYEDTGFYIENSQAENSKYKVYRKRFTKNATVYLIKGLTTAVLPATTLQPAFDLKKVSSYKSHVALFTKNIQVGIVNEKDAVTFRKPAGDVLEFTFSVGVADTYSLTVKYANTLEKTMKAKLQLVMADGTILKEEWVDLLTSKTGKWNYLNGTTGSMINAGTYKLRLIAIDAEGLSISGLEVQ